MRDPDATRGPLPEDPTLTGGQAPPVRDADGSAPVLSEELARRFRVLSRIGRGGMGEVHEAEDLTLGRRVALKAIRADRRLSPAARERFLREARLLSRLDHPGICRIHDLVADGDRDLLVLELIDGRTLSRAADALDDRRRLEVALEIASVLEAAHAEGIVHRDLKPENVMLTREGRVKVLDFGLARDLAGAPVPADASAPGPDPDAAAPLTLDDGRAVLGTPAYLSPEQARGEPAAPASDMYAFGLVLQRLYTGQRPYEDGESVDELIARAREARTRPLTGVDRDLARLIRGLQDPSPARRPTAVATRRRLAWIQRKPARRIRRWSIAAATVLVLAGAGKYVLDLREARGVAERNRAEAEDLVEFMVGDLSERLEPVGRLDVLDDVADRALAYFAARSAEERTDDDRHRFVRALTRIGEVRLSRGDLDAAGEAFVEARDVAARLVDAEPRRGDRLLALGAAEFWLGNVAYLRGDLDGAEARFLAYRDVSERLAALDPADETGRRELGYAHTNLAALHESRGRLDAARAELRESVRIKRELLDLAPGDADRRGDLVNALAWLGRIEQADGELAAAHDLYGAALAAADTLVARSPDDMPLRELHGNLLHLRAGTFDRLGEPAAAESLYAASLDVAETLAAHDPDNAVWREGLSVSLTSLGRLMLARGRPADAADLLDRAADLAGELAAAEPDNVDLLHARANALRTRAALDAVLGDADAARTRAAEAVDVARRAHDRDGGTETLDLLARCLVLAGEIDRRAGREVAAGDAWTEARDRLAPVVGSRRSGTLRDVWVRALANLGETDAAARAAADLAATGYARADFVRFCADRRLLSETALR